MSEFTREELLQQGQVLIGNECYEEAIKKLDQVIELDERCVDAYISKGIALAYLFKLDESEESLKKAILLQKDNPEAYYHLGNVSFMRDNYSEAIKNFNLAVSNGYDSADVFYLIGLMYEQCDEPLQALRNYSKAIRLDELNPMYRIKKTVLEYNMGDYDSALESSEDLRKYCPDNFEGYHLSAAALTMQKKYDQAKEILSDALKKFPEDNEIMMDMLRIHLAAEEYDTATELLEKAKNNNPSEDELKEIYLNMGKIAIVEEKIDEGIEYLQKSLNVGPFGVKDFETEFVLLNIYQTMKQFDKMLDMAKEIIKEHGDEPYALSGHYYAALAMKNIDGADYKAAYKDAIRFYRQFTLQQAGRVDGYVYRAMCHRDLEEYEKAIECLDYVILLAPNRKELHILKSEILKEMGKEAESTDEKRKAEQMSGVGLPSFLGGA